MELLGRRIGSHPGTALSGPVVLSRLYLVIIGNGGHLCMVRDSGCLLDLRVNLLLSFL